MEHQDLAGLLGKKVRQLRQEQGLSLSQLAHGIEPQITRFHLSHVERGTRLPSLRILAALAERLGVEPFELLLFEQEEGDLVAIVDRVKVLPPAEQRKVLRYLKRRAGDSKK